MPDLEPLHARAAERLTRATRNPMSRLRRDTPAVSGLLARLDDLNLPIGESLEADRSALMRFGRLAVQLDRVPPERFPPEIRPLAELRVAPEHASAWAALLAYLRAEVLTQHYHMDPAFMHDLMQQYGPMDWRHPAAHGVYWAAMGLERSELLRSGENVDFVNTHRLIIQGLQALMNEGRLAFDPLTGSIDLLPHVAFIEGYEKAVFEGDEISGLYRDLDERDSHFAQGHMNFLATAVVYHFLYGDEEEARAYHRKLRRLYGEKDPDRFNRTLERFVFSEFLEDGVPRRSAAVAFIESRLENAFSRGLAYGDFPFFERQMGIARQAHEDFQKARAYAAPNAPRERLTLPPYPEMVTKVFASFLESPRVDMIQRARVYQQAPSELQRAVYDQIKTTLEAQTRNMGMSFERAFPAPEGYTPPDPEAGEAEDDGAPATIERQ